MKKIILLFRNSHGISMLSTLVFFLLGNPHTGKSQAFITTWKTDNPGSSGPTEITIPTNGSYTYNYDVDWNNDGIFDQFGVTGSVTHDFGVTGTYTIRIRGVFPYIQFGNTGDKLKILDISQWGDIEWEELSFSFSGCSNLNISATDTPDLSKTTRAIATFQFCTSLNCDLNNWNTSTIKFMNGMFQDAKIFNSDLDNWDVSNVIATVSMFAGATSFNGKIEGWKITSLIAMDFMFAGASSFNQDIENWNTRTLESMAFVFSNTSLFNQNIRNWDVSNVKRMRGMFWEASSFNHDLGSWDLGSVNDIELMLNKSGLSQKNYDNTLIGWERQGIPNLTLGAEGLQYCTGADARESLINTYGWAITGDTEECLPMQDLPLSASWHYWLFGLLILSLATFLLVGRGLLK